MAESLIANLWDPTLLDRSVVSPLSILKVQGAELERGTGGLLRGDIQTREVGSLTPPVLRHSFYVIAPTLNNRRVHLLDAVHRQGLPYPVIIDFSVMTFAEFMLERDGAGDQAAAIDQIKVILGSNLVRGTVQSLLAEINDSQ